MSDDIGDQDDDRCPDGEPHDRAACARIGCPNFLAELEDLAPWGTSRHRLKEWAS